MKQVVVLFTLLFSSIFAISQETFEAKNLVVANEVKGKLIIEKYSNVLLYKNTKCDFSSNTVEYKFCEFFNLNSKDELVKFFIPHHIPSTYSKEDYLNKMKIYDNRNNFYTLDSKYIFDYSIGKDIFIKYVNNNEVFPKPVYSVFYMQDFYDNIIVMDMGENFDFGLFLIGSNTSKSINHFSREKEKEIDITLLSNDFLDNIKNSKNNLYNLIDKKYSPFSNNKEDFEEEDVLSNKVTYNYKKMFHDIISGTIIKENKISREEVSEKYRIPLESLTKDSLTVKEIINVKSLNNDFIIIKFYDYRAIVKTDFEIINDNTFEENDVLSVLTKIDFKAFVDLCFSESNEQFPEFEKFKPYLKNKKDGVSINKVRRIIEDNKEVFYKYINNN